MTQYDLSPAISALQKGEIIIYPTDTQYALGCMIDDSSALFTLYALKKRPLDQPLPIAVSDIQMLEHVARITPLAKTLIHHFLPGPLTLVLNQKKTLPQTMQTPANTIAVRIPDHPVALELLRECGPLTITSANMHGKKAEDIETIKKQLNKPLLAIDEGTLSSPPSTIIDARVKTPKLIREGVLPYSTILKAIEDE